MQKLDQQTLNFTDEHIANIAAMFPHCVTEVEDENGRLKKAIDFDLLKQELSANIVEGPKERYRIDWPGKRASLVSANTPITKTLRPAVEESVNFDTTENLYIEGDNLEALKLLQESYLGAIKMIYIDPPYNTGKDFVYNDTFSRSSQEELEESGQLDQDGGRLVANLESNGRFHSDWLSMMYPRLRLARNLLHDDGVIFVSIHDKEMHNMRKILDEIYGENNFLATLIWDKNHSAQAGIFKAYHEYVYVYAKNSNNVSTPKSIHNNTFEAGAMKKESSRHPMSEFSFPAGVRFEAEEGTELIGQWGGNEKVELIDGRMVCENGVTKYPVTLRAAYTQKNQMEQYFYGDRASLVDSRGQKVVEFYFNSTGKIKIVKERGVETPQTTLKSYGSQGAISTALANLFSLEEAPIDNPKSPNMLSDFIGWFTASDDTVLDFFSGSATTAHAVMQLNAGDQGCRKFIMVQLPEKIDEDKESYEQGYRTICDLGKKRIVLAAEKIKNENLNTEGIEDLDIGFRVLKIDESNMKDIYFTPDAVDRASLFDTVDHIKEDRTPEDLLFGVLVDWGVDLTLPIRRESIHGKTVFFVGHDDLTACFDEDLDIEFIKELAGRDTMRVVFKESGFKDDETKINAEQIFTQLSPGTDLRVI